MKYRVSMTSRAEWQLASAALWWSENRSRQQAAEWLEGFQGALRLLAHNPERWTPPAEHDVFPFAARELTYGLGRRKTHRAVFEIRGDEVIVHCIRHLAQQPLTSDDL